MAPKKTCAAPPATELTLISTYRSPYGVGSKRERDAAVNTATNGPGKDQWEPCSDDFRAVAATPKLSGCAVTHIRKVNDVDGFMNAILAFPEHSIRRLNLISHADRDLIALSGTIGTDGTVQLHAGGDDEDTWPYGARSYLNAGVLDDLNRHPTNRIRRDRVRKRFLSSDSEFHLICCHTAVGAGVMLLNELSWTFDIRVCAMSEAVGYHPATNATQITQRNLTSLGANGTVGQGYYCFVPVDPGLDGSHLRPTRCNFTNCRRPMVGWGDWPPGYEEP
jgi:hypothetical protein